MRFVKLAIISAVVFFVLLWLMSLLIPSTVRVSRAIDIRGDASAITRYLSDTSLWKKWMDLNVEQIEVRKISEDTGLIQTSWHYKQRNVQSSFRLEQSAGVTVVQWYFDFRLRWYPWEKIGSITFDKQFGTPMETSLNNLKKLIENSP